MSEHTTFRLETTTGTVVAYLAPGTRVGIPGSNDLFGGARPRGEAPIRVDKRVIDKEIQVTGKLVHSDNMPPNHQSDISTLFGGLPVTPRDQENRIWFYMQSQGGPFHFYDGANEYTASSQAGIDRENGVFPQVQVKDFTPAQREGKPYKDYTLKLRPGLEG